MTKFDEIMLRRFSDAGTIESLLDEALDEVLRLQREIAAKDKEIANLREQKEPEVTSYWDMNDTEYGHGSPGEILELYDDGTVVGIEHVAVVKTTYMARLPPDDGDDADPEHYEPWEVEAATSDEAEAAVEAELARRTLAGASEA